MEENKKQKSPILQEIRRILAEGIKRIDNDECSEAETYTMLSRFNSESKGFYDQHSLVNYDKAMRMLGIKNRNTFKHLCDENCIEQKKLNNQSVGFLRSEIEDLGTRIRNENKKKWLR